MAASKRKPQRSKKTTTKKKTSGNWTKSPLFHLAVLFAVMAMAVMALAKLGAAGTFLFQAGVWLAGILSWPLWLAVLLLPIGKIFAGKKAKIRLRYIVGTVCALAGILLLAGTNAWKGDLPWTPLTELVQDTVPILQGQPNAAGLVGALLYGLCASLFSSTGCYVAAAFLLGLSFACFAYDWLADDTRKKQRTAKIEQARQKRKVRTEQKPAEKTGSAQSSFTIIDASEPASMEAQTLSGIDLRADDIAGADTVKIHEAGTKADKAARKPKESKAAPKKNKKDNSASKDHKEVLETDDIIESIMPGTPHYENYVLPKVTLLDPLQRTSRSGINRTSAKEQGQKLIEILREFSVNARLMEIHIGPSVTKFEIKPEMGVRVSKISNLQNDIQMALGATDIRIEAPIPGKSAVGIEIPNAEKTAVQMKELIAGIPEDKKNQNLLFCLGKDLQGESVYGQMDRMPHLLIAGATGSGKSVCVNSIICSLLMRSRPDEVKLILIDPKKVEFTPYQDVPHLLAPVITDSELANKALKVVVEMMDHRYDLFGICGVRNITAYNAYLHAHPEESLQPLPRIVVIIDELADLMLAGAKEVEQSIQRITQLARAAGIHLIVATQRPSVDVITGVIKANIPSRIAFAVSSAVDSRTILDQTGAERLLGYGDMLYLPNGETSARRIQGVFIKDDEVNRIAEYVKTQGKPRYDDAFITLKDLQSQGGTVSADAADPLYQDVKEFVVQSGKCSTSLIQRRFSIGYARAARLMDVLEQNGIIGPARGSRPREILVENTLE